MRSFPKMPVRVLNATNHSRGHVTTRPRSYMSARYMRKQQEAQVCCEQERDIEIVQTHLGLLALLHAMQEI